MRAGGKEGRERGAAARSVPTLQIGLTREEEGRVPIMTLAGSVAVFVAHFGDPSFGFQKKLV